MQLLILGCNPLVHNLVPSMIHRDWQITILTSSLTCYTEVSANNNPIIVEPNGILIDDMTSAGIGVTDAFWALSEDDSKNTMAAQIAKHIFNIPNVLCLINDHEKLQVFQKLDLELISTTTTISENILSSIGSTS